MVSISACHADGPGSIPGRGAFLLFLPHSDKSKTISRTGGVEFRAKLSHFRITFSMAFCSKIMILFVVFGAVFGSVFHSFFG